MASASLFLALTLGVLTLVVGCLAVGLQTVHPVALGTALGDLGLQVLKDLSWLFSSFIATLLVVALLPKHSGSSGDHTPLERSLASIVLQAAPTLVGVLATSSLVLAVAGASFHPEAAPTFFAPLSLFVVILGLSYSVTSDMTASSPYRLHLVRNVLSACLVASRRTREIVSEVDRSAKPWRDVAVGAALGTLAGATASALLLATEVTYLSGTNVFTELGAALLWLTALSVLATGVGAVSSFVWWTSRRDVGDRFLVLYSQGLLITSYALLAWIVAQVTAGPSGVFVLATCVVPLLSLWLPLRFLPRPLRLISLRRALATAALRSVLHREAAARRELTALAKRRPNRDAEDEAFLALLQMPRSGSEPSNVKS